MIQTHHPEDLELNRNSLWQGLEAALQVASEGAADRARGQNNMFAAPADVPIDEHARDLAALPDKPPFTEAERQRHEKETFGLYITSSPLDTHRQTFEKYSRNTARTLREAGGGGAVILGGLISGLAINAVRNEASRNFGRKMARFDLVDDTGFTKVTVFPDVYAEFEQVIREDAPVFVRGATEVQGDDDVVTILVSKIVHVQDADQEFHNDESLKYDAEFKLFTTTTVDELPSLDEGAIVRVGGAVAGLRRGSRGNNEYATFNLAGPAGAFRVLAFGDLGREWASRLREGQALFAVGRPKAGRDGRFAIRADQLIPAAQARSRFTSAICLTLTTGEINSELVGSLSDLALHNQGDTPLFFKVLGEDGRQLELLEAGPQFRVSATRSFEASLQSLLPADRIQYSAT